MWSDLNVLTGLDCCDKKLAGYIRPVLPLLPLLGGLVGLLACMGGYLLSAKSGWSLVKHISHLLTINKQGASWPKLYECLHGLHRKINSNSNLALCAILPDGTLCLIVYDDDHDIFT